MSCINRRLCQEIETSTDEDKDCDSLRTNRRTKNKTTSKICKPDARRSHTKSIIIERQKTIKKLPKDVGQKQFRSKEIITKEYNTFRDNGTNTVISRPRKCDTDCVTLVRSRDQNLRSCICSSSRRRRSQYEIEDVHTQTIRHDYAHKASTICAETSSIGTQSVEIIDYKMPCSPKLDSIAAHDTCEKNGANYFNKTFASDYIKTLTEYRNEIRRALDNGQSCKNKNEFGTRTPHYGKDFNINLTGNMLYRGKQSQNNEFDVSGGITSQNFMGARKWALSKYLTKGPDF